MILLYSKKRNQLIINRRAYADVVKLVDTPDLGSGAARRGGSSPSIRTNHLKLETAHMKGGSN